LIFAWHEGDFQRLEGHVGGVVSGFFADSEFSVEGGGGGDVESEGEGGHGAWSGWQHHGPGVGEGDGFAAGCEACECEFAGGGDFGGSCEI